MAERKRPLGRGLKALLGEPAAEVPQVGLINCPVDEISPSSLQPRKTFDEEALAELSASIREKGVIEPLIVRRNPVGGYELVAGERRWRAARRAGIREVPAVVIDATDEESLEFAIIENIQREDLNAIEEAEAYRTLSDFGLSQEEIAKKVGKERATVANYLRLLKLPPEVKEALSRGAISMGHARAILSVDGRAGQVSLLGRIVSKGLSVREAERLASGRTTDRKKKRARTDPSSTPLEDDLRRIFGTKIEIKERNGRGKVEIHYYSPVERERILDLLKSIA